ncbi:hypothetical protein AB5J62_06395 [Amycolatopsis sp. cg5]|uniref:hypothetical protein n=1 Tax=Amycolatopsis sp. cg5 TaxID=3238802 RepID=UPI0035256BE1
MKYLGSTKNLAGCLAGFVGVLLYLTGVIDGWLWLPVVAALYAVGALLAPPERVRLVPVETGQLRDDLRKVLDAVRAQSARMPDTAVDRVTRIGDIVLGMLDRPAELRANPDVLHSVTRLATVDLPLSVQSYLNLPWWFAAKRAGGELITQLDLLETDAHRVAEQFYSADIRQQADHTRYLRDRGLENPGPENPG